MNVMPYLIPAVLTFLVGLALWIIRRERKLLEYEVIASEPFPHGARTGKYFIIRLRNSGNTPVQDTRLRVSFSQGTIESARCSDDRLVTDLRTEGSELECTYPLLNPGERLALTVTAVGDRDISPPEVMARSLGVTATARREDSLSPYVTMVTSVVIVAGATTVLLVFWSSRQQAHIQESIAKLAQSSPQVWEAKLEKQKAELERERREEAEGRPDSPQVVFAILNSAGPSHLMARLIETGQDVTYWKTGLLLVHSFLLDQSNGTKYVGALEQLVATPMAASSLGFNLYLLAKIEKFRGNRDKAVNYLERCKKETPLMYEHLMRQDPLYDLAALQRVRKSRR